MLPYDKKKLKEIFDIIKKYDGYVYCVLEAKKIKNFSEANDLLLSYKLRDYLDQYEQPSIESIRNMIN